MFANICRDLRECFIFFVFKNWNDFSQNFIGYIKKSYIKSYIKKSNFLFLYILFFFYFIWSSQCILYPNKGRHTFLLAKPIDFFKICCLPLINDSKIWPSKLWSRNHISRVFFYILTKAQTPCSQCKKWSFIKFFAICRFK